MALTKNDLLLIEALLDRKLDEKLDEKLNYLIIPSLQELLEWKTEMNEWRDEVDEWRRDVDSNLERIDANVVYLQKDTDASFIKVYDAIKENTEDIGYYFGKSASKKDLSALESRVTSLEKGVH